MNKSREERIYEMSKKITKTLVSSGVHTGGNNEIKERFKKEFELISKRRDIYKDVFKHVRINLFFRERQELEKRYDAGLITLSELIKRWSSRVSRQKNRSNHYNTDCLFLYLQNQSLLEKRLEFELERIKKYGKSESCQRHFDAMMEYYFKKLNNNAIDIFNCLDKWKIKNDDLIIYQLGETSTCVVKIPHLLVPLYVHKDIVKRCLNIKRVYKKEAEGRMMSLYENLSKYQNYNQQGILLI